jgi:hypothetical protein
MNGVLNGVGGGVATDTDRDLHSGKFTRGNNARHAKQLRIDRKAEELRIVFFPNGGMGIMDANRLKLAAQHYVTAETSKDPIVAQRATRCAEYLLSKLRLAGPPNGAAAGPTFGDLLRRNSQP